MDWFEQQLWTKSSKGQTVAPTEAKKNYWYFEASLQFILKLVFFFLLYLYVKNISTCLDVFCQDCFLCFFYFFNDCSYVLFGSFVSKLHQVWVAANPRLFNLSWSWSVFLGVWVSSHLQLWPLFVSLVSWLYVWVCLFFCFKFMHKRLNNWHIGLHGSVVVSTFASFWKCPGSKSVCAFFCVEFACFLCEWVGFSQGNPVSSYSLKTCFIA